MAFFVGFLVPQKTRDIPNVALRCPTFYDDVPALNHRLTIYNGSMSRFRWDADYYYRSYIANYMFYANTTYCLKFSENIIIRKTYIINRPIILLFA